jgi:hypothetical protein
MDRTPYGRQQARTQSNDGLLIRAGKGEERRGVGRVVASSRAQQRPCNNETSKQVTSSGWAAQRFQVTFGASIEQPDDRRDAQIL